ncbi:MAG: laminin B domain-containing protein [Anaerohalosphaeraceae bacterium]
MRTLLYLGLLSFSALLCADTIYGLKSRSNNTGGPGEYLTPATLFSFEDNGSAFTSIGIITKNAAQIRADAIAYSQTQGLWFFEPTTTTSSTLYQLDPTTATVISNGVVFPNTHIFTAAFDRHGRLWAADSASKSLLTIDIAAGQILRSVPLTLNSSSYTGLIAEGADLCFDALGQAFLIDYSGIYSLNTYTGALTELYQDTTPYAKFLVGAAIPASRPDSLFAFEVSKTSIDNDDIFVYNLNSLAQPNYVLNSILDSYNAGRGDLATHIPADLTICTQLNSNTSGWTGAALSTANLTQIVQTLPISHDAGGWISLTDQDNEWTTFAAPTNYLGDRSDWLGGQIALDMLHTTAGTRVNGPMVFLVSGDSILCSPWAMPTDSWQHYIIPLRPVGWHLNTSDGPEPTLAQMLAVLSNLQAMYIIGDYVSGTETTSIDNICIISGLSPDLSRDGFINYEDFALFAPYWQQTLCAMPGWCDGTNLNQDGAVDLNDLEYLVVRWLQEVH